LRRVERVGIPKTKIEILVLVLGERFQNRVFETGSGELVLSVGDAERRIGVPTQERGNEM